MKLIIQYKSECPYDFEIKEAKEDKLQRIDLDEEEM